MKKAYFCVLMKKTFVLTLLTIVLVSSCKSEFEKIRSANDPTLHYTKAMEFYESGEYQKAQTLLELVISSYKGKKEAEDIYFKYAYTFFYLERYILASYYFNNFSQTYGGSDLREEADFMSAFSQYKMSPIFRLDQSNTKKAIDEMQLYVNTYPLSPRVEECNRLIDDMRAKLEEKAYNEGILYFNLRQYQSSVQVLENLLKDFPETNRAFQVRYDIIKSMYLLAENSIITKQEERYTEVLTNAKEYLEKYPDSPYINEINSIINNSNKTLKSVSNVGYQN